MVTMLNDHDYYIYSHDFFTSVEKGSNFIKRSAHLLSVSHHESRNSRKFKTKQKTIASDILSLFTNSRGVK